MHERRITELESVLAVARRGSFRAAAADLGMSTSALSSTVAGLEKRLGARLFHRTTRSVSPTDAGRRFIARIGPALQQVHEAMAEVGATPATPTGTLRINASLGAALMAFQPIAADYLRRYPGMTLDIVTEGRLVDIVAEGFDAGLRVATHVPRDMIRVPVTASVPMVVVGSPAYFERHAPPTTPDHLAAHRCIRARQPGGALAPWRFDAGGSPRRITVPGSLVLDAPLLMREAALHGLGLAQVAGWYVDHDIAAGRLVTVLDRWTAPAPAPGLCLYYPGHRLVPPGLRALIETVRSGVRA